MNFGDRLQQKRKEMHMSRAQLAESVGVSPSAISNYEQNISFPKSEVLLRLFDALGAEPNELFQDSFQSCTTILSEDEKKFLCDYRSLSPEGKESIHSILRTLIAAGCCAPTDTEKEL